MRTEEKYNSKGLYALDKILQKLKKESDNYYGSDYHTNYNQVSQWLHNIDSNWQEEDKTQELIIKLKEGGYVNVKTTTYIEGFVENVKVTPTIKIDQIDEESYPYLNKQLIDNIENKLLLHLLNNGYSISIHDFEHNLNLSTYKAEKIFEQLYNEIPSIVKLYSGDKENLQLTSRGKLIEYLESGGYQIKSNINITTQKDTSSIMSNEIFIVHGHDEAIQQMVARTIEALGLKPIILSEQPNQGNTVIEKFERHSNNTSFAIVLLTPDDEGKANKEDKLRKRARQNVILELGYFIGKIGRDRVLPLYVTGVELPSDITGVVYTLVDTQKRWQIELIKELKAAGYNVDANKIL